jgi:hypothetical protein
MISYEEFLSSLFVETVNSHKKVSSKFSWILKIKNYLKRRNLNHLLIYWLHKSFKDL